MPKPIKMPSVSQIHAGMMLDDFAVERLFLRAITIFYV
jgi:hypothetical protein